MDKNLHNDLGDWFREKIEPMSQSPREEIWENLEQQLDKTDASKYKTKFLTARNVAAILFFLLMGFATATFFYIKKTNNKNADNKNMNTGNKINISKNKTTIDSGNMSIISSSTHNKNFNQNSAIIDNQNNTVNNFNARNKSDAFKKSYFKRQGRQLIVIKNGIPYEENFTQVKEMQSVPLVTNIEPAFQQAIESIAANQINQELELIAKNKIKSSKSLEVNSAVAKYYKKNKISDSRYSFTAFAAPEFAGYYLENDDINVYGNKQIIEQRENSLLSSSGGILISRKINKRLSIQSGIIYSSANISIDPTKIYAVKDDVGNIKYRYNTSSGFAYFLPSFSSSPLVGDSLYTRVTTHNLQYISVPLMMKYSFEKKKFSFNPAVGVSFNFLTKAKLKTEIENSQNKEIETTTKLESTQKLGYSLLAMPEIQYKLSDQWALSATPYFKYALTPITKAYVVRTYPFNVGLGIGVAYKF